MYKNPAILFDKDGNSIVLRLIFRKYGIEFK